MTQRIFKKSCKQDMIDLFNILPDWCNFIIRDTDLFYCKCALMLLEFKPTFENNRKWNRKFGDVFMRSVILSIDFETDKVEEMIIERPKEDNDK